MPVGDHWCPQFPARSGTDMARFGQFRHTNGCLWIVGPMVAQSMVLLPFKIIQ